MLGEFSDDVWKLSQVQPLGVQLGRGLQNVFQDKLVCVCVGGGGGGGGGWVGVHACVCVCEHSYTHINLLHLV